MAEELVGNCLIGQSGGPTAVINASVAGVVAEALNHSAIEEVYGALNGVLGLLGEDLVDLAAESQQAIRGLRYTPGAALGSCRTKLKKPAGLARLPASPSSPFRKSGSSKSRRPSEYAG